MNITYILLIATFLVSLISSIAFAYLSGRSSLGNDLSVGVQKVHKKPTSRLGGVGLVLGVGFFLFFSSQINSTSSSIHFSLLLFLSSIPIFMGGLLEDLTHAVSPRIRLLLAILSANCFWFFCNIGVERTDVLPIDWLLQWTFWAYLVTNVVIAGFTHSINIIDGFNGLASSQILLMLFFFSLICFNYNETELLFYCLSLIAVSLAFFSQNWPLGKIFLGDGGAYFLGSNVVYIGLALVHRHSDLSPFTPIMLGLYPLIEALFSIYRRVWVRNQSMNNPDALHLHSLIYQRIIKKKYENHSSPLLNSKVAIYFFFTSFFFDILSFFYQDNTKALFLFFTTFIFLYIAVFKRIVNFKFRLFNLLR